MKARLLFSSALALSCACANLSTIGPGSDCVQDLMDHGYMTGGNRGRVKDAADRQCRTSTPEQIAAAKALFDGKYHETFSDAMVDVKKYTPAQLECAKKTFAEEKTGRFYVSQACQETILATNAPTTDAAAAGSLYGVLKADGRFTKYLALVDAAGMADTLKAGGPWTVMAPTDESIAKDAASYDNVMARDWQQKDLVKTSLVVGKHQSSELKASTRKKNDVSNQWETAMGSSVVLILRDGAIKVNTSKVIKADIPASNGLIFAVDGIVF